MPEPIEICGNVKRETANAILFYDGVIEAWLPLSQIEIEELRHCVEVKMPEWLARKKGFI